MRSEKLDRRVKYTRMVLRQSMLELMKEKPMGKVTVTDICACADVNRNTFYAHYSSPDELLRQIEDELFDTISVKVDAAAAGGDIVGMLEDICGAIMENADICSVLFSGNGDQEFLDRIVSVKREEILASWRRTAPSADETSLQRLYTFMRFGSIAVIREWVLGGMHDSQSEVASLTGRICESAVAAVIGDKNALVMKKQ